MIAYFDTSAIVPLVVEERGSATAIDIWNRADRVVTVRLTHVEARSALAHAARLGRLTASRHRAAKGALAELLPSLDWVEVDLELMLAASELAETKALRAYDAVHLAAAERLGPSEVVVVAGDRALLAAARERGVAAATIG